jgi:hypothetical protein
MISKQFFMQKLTEFNSNIKFLHKLIAANKLAYNEIIQKFKMRTTT